MSDGATRSAPARAWLTAVRASSSSVASLSTVAVLAQHAAVPVGGVLAQAHVGDHEQLRHGLLDRARGQLHDALLVPRARAVLVLLGGQPEQHHRGDPQRGRLPRLGDGRRERQAIDAGHRRDRLAAGRAPSPPAPAGWLGLGHEQRQHELAGAQRRSRARARAGRRWPAACACASVERPWPSRIPRCE